MTILTRRNLLKTLGVLGVGVAATGGGFSVWRYRGEENYQNAIAQYYLRADLAKTDKEQIVREVARYATMAPNSHNSQPWRIELQESAITIRPDESRRCPAVDPDDHHLYVSLGCAAENAIQAASAYGLRSEFVFDASANCIRVEFSPRTSPGKDPTNPLFDAVPLRQSTRGPFDGQSLTNEELDSLKKAGSSENVNVTLMTTEGEIESILELVIEGNKTQMLDPEFVAELRQWIRSSYFDAVKRGDGLFSLASGYSAAPDWIGKKMFDMTFKEPSETEKYKTQCRSSAGIAILTANTQNEASWTEVGKCFERFALQATAMNVLHSHINQPIEVASLRPQLAGLLGEMDKLPDLVIRFGRGKRLPKSLRRPLDDVITW